MAFWLTDGLFNAAMKGGWSAAKHAGRGIKGGTIGKTVKTDAETGLKHSVSPFRDGYMQQIKNNGKSIATGKKYDKHSNAIDDSGSLIKNRLGGLAGMAGNLTVGAPLHAMGWAAGTTAKIGLGTGAYVGKQGVKQLGYSTREAFSLFGDTAIGAAGLVTEMGKTKRGQTALFGMGALGVFGYGAAKETLNGTNGRQALKLGLEASVGEDMTQVPGSLSSQIGPQDGDLYVDDMGANGDLVLAMHRQR